MHLDLLLREVQFYLIDTAGELYGVYLHFSSPWQKVKGP